MYKSKTPISVRYDIFDARIGQTPVTCTPLHVAAFLAVALRKQYKTDISITETIRYVDYDLPAGQEVFEKTSTLEVGSMNEEEIRKHFVRVAWKS